jgi:multiple sugar transport system substrate-binding protein
VAVLALRGMTWDHPRGLDSLVASNDLLIERCGVSVEWTARSLLAFGDQHISEFYRDFDLMVIDHPHVPDAVEAKAVIPFEDVATAAQLEELALTSVGASHDSYLYRGRHWALAIDAAAQVSAFRPDKADSSPIYWSEVFALARKKVLLWPHKPVDAFSTFATLMAQKGQPLASRGQYINDDIALEVLTIMLELATLVPDWCATSSPIDVAEALSEGDEYSHAVALYGYSNYSRNGFRKNGLVYEEIPSFDGLATGSQLGGAGISVSSASSNKEKAAAAAILLALPEIQSTTYGMGGGQPGNLIAWKNHRLNEATDSFFSNTLRTLERAWVRPRVLGWPDVQFESSQVIHKALVNRTVTTQVVADISAMYEKYVQE